MQGNNGKERLVFTSSDDGVTHATSPLVIPLNDIVIDTPVAHAILKPVVIPRRRRSTEAEVLNMLDSVRDHTTVLKETTENAYQKAGLASNVPSTIQSQPTVPKQQLPPATERSKGFHPGWLKGHGSVDEYESEAGNSSDAALSDPESV